MKLSLRQRRVLDRMDSELSGDPVLAWVAALFAEPAKAVSGRRSRRGRAGSRSAVSSDVRHVAAVIAAAVAITSAVAGAVVAGALPSIVLAAAAVTALIGVSTALVARSTSHRRSTRAHVRRGRAATR